MKETLCLWRNCILVSLLSLCLIPYSLSAQTQTAKKTVTGKVTDENSKPLEGATVSVKGTSDRTSTKADGSFTIQAVDKATLVVSSVGYADFELSTADRTSFNISLSKPRSTGS